MISQEQKNFKKNKKDKISLHKISNANAASKHLLPKQNEKLKMFRQFSAIRVITKTQLNFKPKSLTAEVAAGEVE